MESEKITKLVAATNESADKEGPADCGEPSNSNIQSEDDRHLRSLLSCLYKDQLVDILVQLSMKIPQVAEGLRTAARPTASHRKLIVHGFSEETTSETLSEAFSNSYGEVEDANITVDRTTGKSRGFGSITFKSLESVKKALEKQKTWVDGRLARQHPPSESEIDTFELDPRKLIVSRISTDVTSEMFLRFFEKYGELEKAFILHDKGTKISKGLGFVTFKTVEGAKAAISDPNKILGKNRISVEIKRLKKKKIINIHESSVNYTPQVHHNRPSAIAPRPQHCGLLSQVPHPHFIRGYEPHGILPTVAYQPWPTGTNQYEPYGIPVAYQPQPVAYQPYFSGYGPHGIPPAYQAPTVTYQPPPGTYQPHFSGYQTYGIPIAYQPPAEAYQPHFVGYESYGIPVPYQALTVVHQPPTGAYQPPSGAYQPPTGAYQPATGFMAYPYYFAYQ